MSLEKHTRLNSALKSFTKEYCENPIKYLYEVDTQVLLSKHLEKEFNEKHILKAQVQVGPNEDKEFNIGKVHREYPRYILTKPIDNVVLGKPRPYTDEQLKEKPGYENFYEQPIEYAIELKLISLNEGRSDRLDISIGDYIKFVDKKLTILKEHFNFKYGIQLTLFQSIEDQGYIEDLDDKKWEENYERKRKKYFEPNKDKFGFYYIDMESKELKPIWK